jgi:restriction endonuclease Mrr
MTIPKRNKKRGNYKVRNALGALMVSITMVAFAAGCSFGPSQPPQDTVKNFLAEHLKMTDTSLAKFYDTSEQPTILERIARSIKEKKEKGTFDMISNAKYDLSNVKIKVLDEKADYVNDEEFEFAKVAAVGSYSVIQGEKKKELKEDEVFILKAVGDNWKVTEKLNPWH